MAFIDWLKKNWPDLVAFGAGGPLGSAFYNAGKGITSLMNSGFFEGDYLSKANDSINDFNSAQAANKVDYTEGGLAYDRTNPDSMINAQNMEYAYKRDDTAIDRMFDAYKRVGINPVLAFSNSAGETLASSASTGHYSQNANEQMNSALKAGGILAIIIKMLASL